MSKLRLKEVKEYDSSSLKFLTEMCDICGKDIPIKDVIRTEYVSQYGAKYVIRRHSWRDPYTITQHLL